MAKQVKIKRSRLEKKINPVPVIRAEKKEIIKKPFIDHAELPANYNTTKITLMARDPYWLYAYWEVNPSSVEELRKAMAGQLDNFVYLLRMYDVTLIDFNGQNAHHWFDIEVGPQANNWYINLWRDNVTYCVELGLRNPEGRFFPLARSNFVTTPRVSSSGRTDMVWMEVKDTAADPQPYCLVSAKPSSLKYKGQHVKTRRKIFLTEEDIRRYYSGLFPFLKQAILARMRRDKKRTGLARYKFQLKNSDILVDSPLLSGLSREEFFQRLLLGASAEMVLKRGASERISSGASQQIAGEKEGKFFFEVGTELIVYGRTEPDAEVWLQDKKVPLRQDGTFTLRFALPDGKIPLNFTALSKDKAHSRSIATAVERSKTKYHA